MNGLLDEDRFKTLRLMRGGKRLEVSGSQPMPVPERPGAAMTVPIPAPPDVDYVSLGVDLMATRKLQALPVAVIPAPQAEVEKIILAWLRRQLPGDASQRQGRALAALGVIPEAVDVLPLRSALLARQVCGWYDAEKDTLFVVDAAAAPPGTMPPPTEPVLAMAHGQLLREFQKTLLPEGTALTTDARLAREVKQILSHAIKRGGTTLRDFISPDGEPGYFELELMAYGRAGEPFGWAEAAGTSFGSIG